MTRSPPARIGEESTVPSIVTCRWASRPRSAAVMPVAGARLLRCASYPKRDQVGGVEPAAAEATTSAATTTALRHTKDLYLPALEQTLPAFAQERVEAGERLAPPERGPAEHEVVGPPRERLQVCDRVLVVGRLVAVLVPVLRKRDELPALELVVQAPAAAVADRDARLPGQHRPELLDGAREAVEPGLLAP